MIKSISTQTGDFSYSLNLQFTGYGPFEFGWSGQSKIFSFSGQSGNLYDNSSNLFYSYSQGESLTISGNRVGNYNNYFVNDVLFNSNNSQNTGYVENFFANGPVSPQISFKGNQPNYRVASGRFQNGSQTGLIYIYNDGAENFKFYSGRFTGPSGEIFGFRYPFDSGNITSAKQFTGTSLLAQGGTGKYPVVAEFYTNFGLITKSFDIFSLYDLETNLSLTGPSFANSTGNYDYTLDYDLFYGSDKSTDPYNIFFEFRNESGRGDFANFTGSGTGYYTGTTYDLTISNTISESGRMTGLIDIDISGANPFLGIPYTGNHQQTYTSGAIWTTGDFDFYYQIPSSGLASGFLENTINAPISMFPEPQAIGFTGELPYGFHTVTGTGLTTVTGLSYYGGNSWYFSGDYTGFLTGQVFSSGTTGIINDFNQTGFVSGQWIERNDVSGYWDIIRSGSYGLVTGQFTGQAIMTGLISGFHSGTIFQNSGTLSVNEQKTGIPFITYDIFQSGDYINPFTGQLNTTFTGTGFYSEDITINLEGSGFFLSLPTYLKTFSGEYKFYTGITTGNLIEMDYDISNNLWSGVNTVTGENSFIMRIEKTRDILTDSLYLFYSGQNNTTGGSTITS